MRLPVLAAIVFPALGFLALGFLAVGAPLACAADVDAQSREAERAAVVRLAELAAWAGQSSLRRERDRTYATILKVDPDHAEARKALKYARGEDSRWKQAPGYREPKNAKPANLPEFERRYAEVAAELAGRLLPLLKDPGLATWPDARTRILADLAAVAPDDPQVRAANGEVDDRGVWRLEETVRGRDRRETLVALARSTLAQAAEPPTVEPTAPEQGLGVKWTTAFADGVARIVGTTGYDEVLLEAKTVYATPSLWRAAIGANAPRLPDFSLYFLKDLAEAKVLLANHTGFTPAQRKWAEGVNSTWVPGHNHVLTYGSDKTMRVEWAARQPFGAYLRVQLGVTERAGWAWEGVGIYLTQLLTGSHLTYFVQSSSYVPGADRSAEGLWKRLKDASCDWRVEGRALLAASKTGDLRLLLGKDVSAMTAQDVLHSYVVAAWLIEGRPEAVQDLLRRVGKGASADDAFAKSLHLTIEAAEERIRRWISESVSAS